MWRKKTICLEVGIVRREWFIWTIDMESIFLLFSLVRFIIIHCDRMAESHNIHYIWALIYAFVSIIERLCDIIRCCGQDVCIARPIDRALIMCSLFSSLQRYTLNEHSNAKHSLINNWMVQNEEPFNWILFQMSIANKTNKEQN